MEQTAAITQLRHLGAPAAAVESFDSFFLREYRPMVALAAATTGDHSIAEDLAQEAMRRAYRRWPTVGAYDKPGAWLRRVTINLAVSARRRRQSEVAATLRFGRERVRTMPEPAATHAPVWDAVGLLPRNQRAAVALHYLEDRSVADIAEILGCAPATARVHLHRGRVQLRSLLGGPDT